MNNKDLYKRTIILKDHSSKLEQSDDELAKAKELLEQYNWLCQEFCYQLGQKCNSGSKNTHPFSQET